MRANQAHPIRLLPLLRCFTIAVISLHSIVFPIVTVSSSFTNRYL